MGNSQKRKTADMGFSAEEEEVREALSNTEAEEEFQGQIVSRVCVARYTCRF